MLDLAGAVIISGFSIVFAALVILIGVVSLTGRIVNKEAFAPKPPQSPTPPTPPTKTTTAPPAKGPAAAPVVQSGIAQETVAVISAAVAAVMDEQAPGVPYSLESIQRQGNRQGRPAWGFAGMQQNTRPF